MSLAGARRVANTGTHMGHMVARTPERVFEFAVCYWYDGPYHRYINTCILFYFCILGTIPRGIQGWLLVLCSKVTPSGAQRPYIWCWVDCVQGGCLIRCSLSLSWYLDFLIAETGPVCHNLLVLISNSSWEVTGHLVLGPFFTGWFQHILQFTYFCSLRSSVSWTFSNFEVQDQRDVPGHKALVLFIPQNFLLDSMTSDMVSGVLPSMVPKDKLKNRKQY